jgi:hypothetical protein
MAIQDRTVETIWGVHPWYSRNLSTGNRKTPEIMQLFKKGSTKLWIIQNLVQTFHKALLMRAGTKKKGVHGNTQTHTHTHTDWDVVYNFCSEFRHPSCYSCPGRTPVKVTGLVLQSAPCLSAVTVRSSNPRSDTTPQPQPRPMPTTIPQSQMGEWAPSKIRTEIQLRHALRRTYSPRLSGDGGKCTRIFAIID